MDLARLTEVAAAGAAAGINPWLAALTFVALGHFGLLELGEVPVLDSALGDTPVLLALGAAFLIEQVADKIPALDHLSDLVHLPLKPVAAAALAVVVLDPGAGADTLAWGAAIGSGVLALLAHLGKAGLRAGSTATTGGLGNPILSVLEDLGVVVLILAAVLVPLLALGVVALVAFLGVRWIVRFARRRGQVPEAPAA